MSQLTKSFLEGEAVWYKVISGRPHPISGKANQVLKLGIAFRSVDAPIGYYPFYDNKDYNYDGSVSFMEEWVLSRMPINMSDVASPYTTLLRETAGDVGFLGAGEPDVIDITKEVQLDLLGHAMSVAAGVFVDSMMTALGGPAVKTIVGQFTKSTVKKFIISKAISGAMKAKLRKYASDAIKN